MLFTFIFNNTNCSGGVECEVDAALKCKIAVPTLLIWGTEDSFLEKQSAEMSSRFVEDLTIKFIEFAHHFVQQEEPQQVNLLMRQFLST